MRKETQCIIRTPGLRIVEERFEALLLLETAFKYGQKEKDNYGNMTDAVIGKTLGCLSFIDYVGIIVLLIIFLAVGCWFAKSVFSSEEGDNSKMQVIEEQGEYMEQIQPDFAPVVRGWITIRYRDSNSYECWMASAGAL